MKIPNDLIKSTDLEKSKDRIIHEFECVNGKFIHHYVLGGEDELTPQEIVDCLNALATIDCDLQTSYAYIKGQNEKIKDIQSQLAEKEKRLKIIDEFKNNYGYTNYEDEYMLEDLQSRAFQAEDDTEVVESLLDYFNINDENEILTKVKSQLEEKDKEIEEFKKSICDKCRGCIQRSGYLDCAFRNFDNEQCGDLKKIVNEYAIHKTEEQLDKVKELCDKKFEWWENSKYEGNIYDKLDVSNAYLDISVNIGQQINELKGGTPKKTCHVKKSAKRNE